MPSLPSVLGLISDTHGLMREEALDALRGTEMILHAGDVGKPGVLETLRTVAPVAAIRGNADMGTWAADLPETALMEAEGARIYLIHDLKQLDLDPAREGIQIVVSGHTHRPTRQEKAGVLYINPGGAGPRRFRLPVTVARLKREQSVWRVEFVDVLAGCLADLG